MTTLANILSDLSYGVLSNLHLGSSGNGSIEEKHLPKIMVFINDGLAKLYTKFILSRKVMDITVAAGDTEFRLSTGDKDCLKVLAVEELNADGEYDKLPLNDSAAIKTGACTPAIDILKVPVNPDSDVTYRVHYQARHPRIEVGDLGSKDIELPDTLYEALTMYVAYRAYLGINTQEASATAGAYLSQFTLACGEVTTMDTVAQSQSHTNSRFQNNGWG